MRSTSRPVLLLLLCVALLILVVAPVASAASGVTPDVVKALFDGGAVVIMFAWGLICKYVPGLKAIPNALIGWVNVVGYVLTHLGAGATIAALLGIGTAYAGSGFLSMMPGLVGALIPSFTNAVWARQLYEGFGRGVLEGWLHLDRQPHIQEARLSRGAVAAAH